MKNSIKKIILFLSVTIWLITTTTTTTTAFAQALDLSFNHGTGPNGAISTTAIQSDGKIIIGGDFTSYDGTERNSMARLNDDGSIDTSFDPGTGANNIIRTISIQGDGKIIIGGNFTSYNGTNSRCIARLNVDGSLDTSFDPGTGASIQWQTASIFTTSLQDDGKIIIGGNFKWYNGTTRNRIARLNTDGSLDPSFEIGFGLTHLNDRVYTTAIQSDGKIIIGGNFSLSPYRHVARLNTDGSFDTSFVTGFGANDQIQTISIQNDGKIIIGGWFTAFDQTVRNRTARLNTNGSLDLSFESGTPIVQNHDKVHATGIQSDGKIIIAGTIAAYESGIGINGFARLNTDGSLDTSFDPEAGVSGSISTISIQSDGKIIVAGGFSSYHGTSINHIARIDTFSLPVGIHSLK
nr:delta-60 repeat domain-containing protein [Bacteroidota bacterium]